MTILDVSVLGVVQGLTEFLPVSSSGHLILAREVFGFSEGGGVSSIALATEGLAFDAILHFATAIAIIVYFWKDFLRLLNSAYRFVAKRIFDTDTQFLVALIVATIPAVIFGLMLESILDTVFRNALLVVGALATGSLIMLLAEKYQHRGKASVLNKVEVGWKKGVAIGLFQSLALVPGMSRSGMAISGGMLMGLSRGASARFAFMLGAPLFIGAGAKKMLDMGANGALASDALALIAGGIASFIVALAVIHWLIKYLRDHSMMPFIWYRLLVAALVLFIHIVY